MKLDKAIICIVLSTLALGLPLTVNMIHATPSNVGNFSTVNSYTSFLGLNQSQSGNVVPPDVQVAAGPNYVVEMVNDRSAIFTKQGVSVNLGGFACHSPTSTDPKVLFDNLTNRWFCSLEIVTKGTETGTSYTTFVSVSDTSDPTGTWHSWTFDPSPYCGDQPIIGLSDDKVVLSVNDFLIDSKGNCKTFVGGQYWVINKRDMLSGAFSVHNATFGPDPSVFSLHPVVSLSSTITQYLVTVGENSTGTAQSTEPPCADCANPQLFSITGVPPGPLTISNYTIAISPILAPPPALEKGTTANINTDDSRVLDAAWFHGKLWFSLNEGCVPTGDTAIRSCLRLVQLDTGSGYTLQDIDFGSAGKYFFYPALRVDGLGDLDIVYGFSSTSDFPGLAISGQAAGEPANSMAAQMILLTANTFNAPRRYGDYFAAAVDPLDSGLVWVAGEYPTTQSIWGTLISGMRVQLFGMSVNNALLTFGSGSSAQSNITLTSVNSFTGIVSLSSSVTPVVSNGPTTSLSTNTLSLASGGSIGATLTVSGSSNTPSGFYTVTVSGTSGGEVHNVLLTVAVTPVVATINDIANFTGISDQTTGALSVDSPSTTLSLSGSITVVATNATTHATLFTKTYQIAHLFVSNTYCSWGCGVRFLLNVVVNPAPLASELLVTPGSSNNPMQVTMNMDVNQDGIVNSVDVNLIGNHIGCHLGDPCYDPRLDINADNVINIADMTMITGVPWLNAKDFLN